MSSEPRILITNDDGIDAPGLQILIGIARQISSDVFVLAPATNQSGAGHRFTFAHEMELQERATNVYALPGSPADCVAIGCTYLLKDKKPDVVLSGVNNGQNLGDVINCSGTVGAAREGAMQGALGIALSQGVDYEGSKDVDWSSAERFGAEVVSKLIASHQQRDIYYNVNFPACDPEIVSGVHVGPHQRFSRSPFAHYASHNEGKFFVAIPQIPQPLNPEHDMVMLNRKHAITVTPLSLDQTDYDSVERLKSTFATGA